MVIEDFHAEQIGLPVNHHLELRREPGGAWSALRSRLHAQDMG
jgi:hypothetical protein